MKKVTISLPTFDFLRRRKVLIPLLLVLALSIGGFFAYQNLQKQFTPKEEQAPQGPPPQVLGLIETVGKHISDLPSNELPNVATIDDIGKLSDQAFFNGAKVGDKVLIYTANRRAVIFRPSTDTIIKSGTVEVDGENASKSATASSSSVLRVKF